jgi:Ca2+-binding EF-hand superfamily protein
MIRNKLKLGIAIGIFTILGSVHGIAQNSERNEKPKTPPSYKELLKKMDTDEDGQLSKEEVKGPLKEDFSKIDANKDGFITEEELKKGKKPKRNKESKKSN